MQELGIITPKTAPPTRAPKTAPPAKSASVLHIPLSKKPRNGRVVQAAAGYLAVHSGPDLHSRTLSL